MTTKTCTKCLEDKPLSAYNKNKGTLHSWCKACLNGTTPDAPPYDPDDPGTTYQAFMDQTPEGVDVSHYWTSKWCQYVGGDQKRTGDEKAQEMRWFWRTWRERNYEAMFEVSEAWEAVPALPVPDERRSRPMREIAIQQHTNRTNGRPADSVYRQLPKLYEEGLSIAEMAVRLGKTTKAVDGAIRHRIARRLMQARG